MSGSRDDTNVRRDEELAELMKTLDAAPHRVAQIEDAVLAAVSNISERQSLAAEWIELLRVRPLFTAGVALAGGAALLLLSPGVGVLAAILGS
jgi:hypothetical protein